MIEKKQEWGTKINYESLLADSKELEKGNVYQDNREANKSILKYNLNQWQKKLRKNEFLSSLKE